ncbi:thiosulfate dehydrogenase [quinone] large subunit [Jatrophihabitans sp. GAS493]|uniref:Rieske 2Fe-2S domain-containing protein n=1 Tax=Jatrophihabitans sp. GAS493 TaxID=1907575 RepID=UPI000BB99959|nr:Rieske 2Fe-2S domain-containing protein [Jatrophihabitans sp. GAS493]SOD74400.1 thiosulfate dehydrogenase [quinone] large subunit [Jatrophihabitans sp. GAS493]
MSPQLSDRWRARAGEPGWLLLPLRAFLAYVFLYGGISKIADPRFLDGHSALSLHATVTAARTASPIGSFLGPVQSHSSAFGLLIALGELAVGVGLACGLFTRVAALGGMLLVLPLWLTVSWRADPWYTSDDVVYLFAFTPILIAGSGGVFEVTALFSRPTASGDRSPSNAIGRRSVLAAGAGAVTLLIAAAAALLRPVHRSRQAGVAPTPVPTPGGGAVLAQASAVAVGAALPVTDPSTGDPAFVLQLQPGDFTAVDAVCPHQGCPVSYLSASEGFVCPCHDSRFTSTGERISGPATRGLTSIPVAVVDGEVRR